jgi:hypothetical protein
MPDRSTLSGASGVRRGRDQYGVVRYSCRADRAVWVARIRGERIDPAKDERYYVHGFKVFPSIVPQPDQNTYVTTYVHPIQSLVWDDFTAEPGHEYTYVFHPLAGTPKKLDRSRPSLSIDIRTEPLIGETHDVFFNRGVASSQTYAQVWQRIAE